MRASMEASSAAARRSAAPDPPGAAKKQRLLAPPRDPRSSAGYGGGASNGSGAAAAAAAEQQAQVDELVAQYRTALGELTFNSKPIITNLTIIAGENLHAARPIAALVCANILEVPSDQKLPSLYLLDSIVKNIGKDYVKHFSSRLPEVFCKAYRQVDPPVHTSMRHLFGTWKGVFSPASLQAIEKELGFQSSANGSSAAAPSKADPPSQRPSHSIHVNPKYLEARQQLQQPNKGILGAGAKTPIISDADDVIERGNRIGIDKGTGRRLDTLNSRPRAQKDTFSNPIREKPDRDVRAPGIAGAGQVRSKPKGQDGIGGAYYTGGVGSPEEIFDRRNHLYATKDVRSSGSARLDSALLPTPVSNSDRIGRLSSSDKSWKNSEEEEYIWDDIRSQGADYGGASSARKGEPLTDDGNIRSFHRANWAEPGDPLDLDFHKQDTIPRFGHPTSQDRRLAPYMDHAEYLHSKREGEPRIDREMWPEGQPFPEPRGSSVWLSQEKPRPDIGRDPRISRFSNQPPSITSSVPVGLSGAYAGRSSLESAKQKLEGFKAGDEEAALPPSASSEEHNEGNQIEAPLLSCESDVANTKGFWTNLKEGVHQLVEELMAPPTISAIIGFVVGLVPWLKSLIIGEGAPLRVIQDSLELMGNGTIPCITLILGGNLTQGLRKSVLKRAVIVAIVCIRYVAMPVIGIAVVHAAHGVGFLPHDPLYRYVLMIQFALPPAMNIGTMAQLFDVGQEECSVIFLWTYLVAAVALTTWSTVFMSILS